MRLETEDCGFFSVSRFSQQPNKKWSKLCMKGIGRKGDSFSLKGTFSFLYSQRNQRKALIFNGQSKNSETPKTSQCHRTEKKSSLRRKKKKKTIKTGQNTYKQRFSLLQRKNEFWFCDLQKTRTKLIPRCLNCTLVIKREREGGDLFLKVEKQKQVFLRSASRFSRKITTINTNKQNQSIPNCETKPNFTNENHKNPAIKNEK